MLDKYGAAKLLLLWSRDKLQASGFNVDWIALLAAEGGAASGAGVPAFQDDDLQLAAAWNQACTQQTCTVVLHASLLHILLLTVKGCRTQSTTF